jgi:osmotically-inducible protein OsmY
MDSRVNPGDDVYLAKAIEEAIAADDRTAELGISVEVRAGRAFLHGTVASAQRKEAVTTVAGEHAPGHQILNELTVVDPGDSGNAAEPVAETLR